MDVGGGPRGRELWQFPESPGRQREQRVPFLTQEHLKHLAVPLQRQQRVEVEGRRAPATLLEVAIFEFRKYLSMRIARTKISVLAK